MSSSLREINGAAPELAPVCPICLTSTSGRAPRAATVYVRSDANCYSSAACDECATIVIARVSVDGVTIDRVAGVPLVTTIDGIDVAQFAVECLDGVTGACDLAGMATVPGAITAVRRAFLARVLRPLRPSEQLALQEATRTEVVRRWKAKRAELLNTQASLHRPMFRLGAAS